MHWIVGDIHGMLAPLVTLLGEIERRDPGRQLIFAGDYVNRGPDSKQVIDLLLTLRGARFLRGNHDDVFDQVLHDASYCGKPGEYDRIAAFRWFMNFGLFQTFRSYGVSERQLVSADSHPSARALSELGEFVPAAHHDFLRRLETVVEHEEFFVAHAKWPVGVSSVAPSMSEQLEKSPELRQTIVWGRFAEFELMAEKKWERRGYFGHTPVYTYSESVVPVPIVGPKVVLVDTGAALPQGQRLTAYCHELEDFVQADWEGKLLRY